MGSVSIHQIIYVCLRDRRLNDLFSVVVFFFSLFLFVERQPNTQTTKKLISYKCHLLRKQMNILMTCDNLTVVCLYIDLYYTASFSIFDSVPPLIYTYMLYFYCFVMRVCVYVCVCWE